MMLLAVAVVFASPQRVVVQIDPRAYVFEIRRNVTTFPPDTVAAFNANYYWKGTPIGICTGQKSISKYNDLRPIFRIRNEISILDPWVSIGRNALKGGLNVQAGPTLVKDFCLLDLLATKKREKFQSDVYRATGHVALGISPAGKLIIVYAPAISMARMGQLMMDLGVRDAMSVDGGNSALLAVRDSSGKLRRWGNQGRATVVVLIRRPTVVE